MALSFADDKLRTLGPGCLVVRGLGMEGVGLKMRASVSSASAL